MSYKNILIPLDGSQFAERALHYLPYVAESGAHIHLLTVVTQSHLAETTAVLASTMNPDVAVMNWGWGLNAQANINHALQSCQRYLESLQTRLTEQGYSVVVEAHFGDVVGTILDKAKDDDLILMATHGRTGLSKFVLGSVTQEVLHKAPCPMFIVPAHQPTPLLEDEADAMSNSYQADLPLRVLISLDGSCNAEAILPDVERLLGDHTAKLVILHVEPPLDPPLLNDQEPHARQALEQTEAEVQAKAAGEMAVHEYLQAAVARLTRPNITVITEVGYSRPDDEILFFADLYRADVIAMVTHGRVGLDRVLHGSVTESVLANTSCPMLLRCQNL